MWSFARSAEAMFSRWAMKRLCKFFLKKKLGEFILGDIDLDQLDVQLGAGTIQLYDIALNVDFINQKFGKTGSIQLKEGSIGSVLIKLPWKDTGCEIELNELEVLLTPSSHSSVNVRSENCSSQVWDNPLNYNKKTDNDDMETHFEKHEVLDFHKGVEVILKVVKWLLSSFTITIKKLIIAFDPCLEDVENKTSVPVLVLRISETKCGTSVSENDDNSATDGSTFLGIDGLTAFFNFQGAILELLHLDDLNPGINLSNTSAPVSYLSNSKHNAITSRVPVLTGEDGGLSGTVIIHVPWKDNTLDATRVGGNFHAEPVKFRIQPKSLKWLLSTLELLSKSSADNMNKDDLDVADSTYYNSSSHFNSLLPHYHVNGGLRSKFLFSGSSEVRKTDFQSDLGAMKDWGSISIYNHKKEELEEVDFTASIEEFFECFDGIRSYQSASGNSGMWGWTSSIFSAIRVTSSINSGYSADSSEKQNLHANIGAIISKISVIIALNDEDTFCSCISNDVSRKSCSHGRFMSMACTNMSLSLKVSAKDTQIEASFMHIEAYDHYKNIRNYCVHGVSSRILSRRLQEVMHALPPSVPYSDEHHSFHEDAMEAIMFPSDNDDFIKVPILSSSGTTCCHFSVSSGSSYCGSTKSTLFSLDIASVILWVNINCLSSLIVVLEEISCYQQKSVNGGEAKDPLNTCVRDAPKLPRENLRGSIFFPNARVIFCIPYNSGQEKCIGCCCCSYFSTDFIALNVSSSHALHNKSRKHKIHSPHSSVQKEHCLTSSHSLQFNFGSIDIYLVLPTTDVDDARITNYCSYNVISTANKIGPESQSSMTMMWQQCPTNGYWLVHKARELAVTGNLPHRNEVFGKGKEFTSVSTFKNAREPMSQVRKEIIYGSSLLVNTHFPSTFINLDAFCYDTFYSIINRLIDGFSILPFGSSGNIQEMAASQTSFIVECDSIQISIHPSLEKTSKISAENNFPGYWQHFSLNVQKFELISVSNIGGIRGLNFFWVGHCDGELHGSLSAVRDRDILLISCSNSATGRGDGGGSNLLSHGVAGFDVIYIMDPQNNEISTSVTVRGVTVALIGDRLDWPDLITSFFVADVSSSQHVCSRGSDTIKTSFILNVVDLGLIYEPHISGSSVDTKKHVSCILAAVSLSVSTASTSDSVGNEYVVRVNDLGLLLSANSRLENIAGLYSTEYLKKMGYVKVAGDAFIEAVLRTNCLNGLKWEFECSESHNQIFLDTCDDTTACFCSILTELQQHFSPDIKELVPQLQARWKKLNRKNDVYVFKTLSSDRTSSFSSNVVSGTGSGWKHGAFGLMEERCEDSFHPDGCRSQVGRVSYCESRDPDVIEEYYMPDFVPSPSIPSGYISKENKPNGLSCGVYDVESNGFWYSFPNIMENHIPNATDKYGWNNPIKGDNSLVNSKDVVKSKEMAGRILFKNYSVRWRLYAGSHWCESGKGKGPDKNKCIELQLSGIDFEYVSFPASQTRASNLSLCVRDVFIFDKSNDSPWKLVLAHHESKEHPRDSSSKVVRLNLEATRQDTLTILEEYRLNIAILPLILHLHQSQLDFLINFFCCNIPPPAVEETPSISQDLHGSKPPSTIIEDAFLPYFLKFDIWPFSIRIDYTPCHVDIGALRSGRYAEFVNLVPWKGIELQLKHVSGEDIFGWSNVFDITTGEWLEDICKNQVYNLLQGFPPVRSVVSVGSGAKKLVSFPVQSYRKDGRIIKGVQRGTIAFLKSFSLEAVGLGVHLAAGAHGILLKAENIFTKSPSPSMSEKISNWKSTQPIDAHQGLQQACETLVDGIGRSASALVRSPMKLYNRGGGASSVLASAVRSAPVAAIAPASAIAGALHYTLLGIRNGLDPEHRRETVEKYLLHTCSWDPK